MSKDFSEDNYRRLQARSGCLLCAWGNDLPIGEYCRACGCENSAPLGAFGASIGRLDLEDQPRRTKVFSHFTGPLVEWDGVFLHIEDLSPHVKTRWRMSRAELLRFGWRAINAAIFPPRSGS